MFLSLVRPDRISSPMTRIAAVTRSWGIAFLSGAGAAFEDVVQTRLGEQPVSMPREQGRQVDLPLRAAILNDQQRGMERLGRFSEEGFKDDVLGALDVELHGIDTLELLFPGQHQQG